MADGSRRIEHAARATALASGLVLFAFAAAELTTDAIGLVSLETMGRVAEWRDALIQSSPGTAILGVALLSHIGTTLYLVARRATARMSWSDGAEILSGILVPLLLLPSLVDTRGAGLLFDVTDDTLYRLARLWPQHGTFYVLLILLLWGHGCLGIHQWLKPKPRYAVLAPVLGVVALALPIAAIAGLIASARVIGVLIADESFAAQIRATGHWPSAEAEAALRRLRWIAASIYGVVVLAAAGALVARILRILVAPKIDVTYVNGPALRTSVGPTLLEISRINSVPHADACGGRGRCTACSVRVEQGAAALPPPTAAELAMLGFADPQLRLACQLRPTASLTVTRLTHGANAGAAEPDVEAAGIERHVAALCIQLQDHATLARTRAAYDAIFLLNEFLDAAFEAVSAHDGWMVRMTGGGIVAIFGRDSEAPAACRAALAASAAMDLAMDRLNEKFAAELGRPVGAAMGLALGPAYLGRVGAGPTKTLTAIGPAVDSAIGLAGQAEGRQAQLLSEPAVFHRAGVDATTFELVSLTEGSSTRDVFATTQARLAKAAQA
jgi:adenylate cyclase